MKKKFVSAALTLALTLAFASQSFAAQQPFTAAAAQTTYLTDRPLITLPVRIYAQDAGYSVTWEPVTRSVLLKDPKDASFSARIYIGVNYYRTGDKVMRLESAPEMRDDIVFVPESFFPSVLGAEIGIHPDGSVTAKKIS